MASVTGLSTGLVSAKTGNPAESFIYNYPKSNLPSGHGIGLLYRFLFEHQRRLNAIGWLTYDDDRQQCGFWRSFQVRHVPRTICEQCFFCGSGLQRRCRSSHLQFPAQARSRPCL